MTKQAFFYFCTCSCSELAILHVSHCFRDFEKLYSVRARALVERMLARRAQAATARQVAKPRRLGCSRSTRRQRRKVDKCRVADKKKTDRQTNQQINTHYSFIGIDVPAPLVKFSGGLAPPAPPWFLRLCQTPFVLLNCLLEPPTGNTD